MHSKLAPSSAHRWINCPGSVRLEEEFEDTSSIYAAEGTLAHKLAELKIRDYLGESVDFDQVRKNKLYTNDMDFYTDQYLFFIKSLRTENDKVYVETTVKMRSVHPEAYGTADCILAGDGRLQVVDFKYGQNVKVDVNDNEQLKLYALGVLEVLGSIYNDPKEITVHIFQPRMLNTASITYKSEDLINWGKEVSECAKEALSGKGIINPGDWCKFCKAKPVCKKYSYKYTGINRVDPAKLSLEEISSLLTQLKGLDGYYKELKSYALSLVLQGETIPGYKPVEGRSNRSWSNEEEALKVAKSLGLEDSELYTVTPISVAQLEKRLGKKTFNDKMADYVVKPEGKPTLVEDSDKRLSLNDPKYIFRDVDFD